MRCRDTRNAIRVWRSPSVFFVLILSAGLLSGFELEAQTRVHTRSIGTQRGILHARGVVSIEAGSTFATFSEDAALPPNVGRGDLLVLDPGSASEERLFVASRDGDRRVNLEEPSENGHQEAAYHFFRAFHSIQAWEDARDGDLVREKRREVGVLYDDGPFVEFGAMAMATIDGSRTNRNHYLSLETAESARHGGRAGAGAVLDGASIGKLGLRVRDDFTRIEGLELKRFRGENGAAAIEVTRARNVLLEDLIVHDFEDPGATVVGIKANEDGRFTLRNSILYDGDAAGVRLRGAGSRGVVQNCTVFGMSGRGLYEDAGVLIARNTIAMDNGRQDFDISRGRQARNLSSDGSASGPGSLRDLSSEDQFVSIAAGAEDFHLEVLSDAIDAGSELAGAPAVDIDGDVRPQGERWDIGADEKQQPHQALLDVGDGFEDPDGDITIDITVAGLARIGVERFSFALHFNELLVGDPVAVEPGPSLSDWIVQGEPGGTDEFLMILESPNFPGGASPIADGVLLRVTFSPHPLPEDVPFLPVPVSIPEDSVVGLPVPVETRGGFLNVGVPLIPRIRVGSVTASPGGEASIPITLENLRMFLPSLFVELEIEFDDRGLDLPSVSVADTVLESWEVVVSSFGSNHLLIQAETEDLVDELRNGTLLRLLFPVKTEAEPGEYSVQVTHALIQAEGTILLDEGGSVIVNEERCDGTAQFLDWEEFRDQVRGGIEPLTRNRDCVAGAFARFALYRDGIDGRVRMKVTRPLTFETRGTEADFLEQIAPPEADPSCSDNEVLASGWVSYADWGSLYDAPDLSPSVPGEKRFLFTTENFGELGRIESSSEHISPEAREELLVFFEQLQEPREDRMFPLEETYQVFFSNYPEPRSEFSGDAIATLIPLGGFGGNGGGIMRGDELTGHPYFNDPAERARFFVTAAAGSGVTSDVDGSPVHFPASPEITSMGIFSVACNGQIALRGRDVDNTHSQFWGGAHVAMAGQMIVNQGELCYIDSGSGHYAPPREHFEAWLETELPDFDFEPVQPYGDYFFTAPRGRSPQCDDSIAQALGVEARPSTLRLTGGTGEIVEGKVTLISYRNVDALWAILPFESWLTAEPSRGTLPPGEQTEVTFRATCPATPTDRTSRYLLADRETSTNLGLQLLSVRNICEDHALPTTILLVGEVGETVTETFELENLSLLTDLSFSFPSEPPHGSPELLFDPSQGSGVPPSSSIPISVTTTCPSTAREDRFFIVPTINDRTTPALEVVRRCTEGDTGGSWGDPHLRTFDNLRYDLQAVGEFVFSRATDFEVQVRHEPWGSRHVSVNTAVAALLDSHRIGFYALEAPQLRVDGAGVGIGVGEDLPVGGGRILREAVSQYLVEWPNGRTTMRVWFRREHLDLRIHPADLEGLEGLMGNHNGDPLDDFRTGGPNARVLETPSFAELHGLFADSWRVVNLNDATSLFDYPEGKGPGDFDVPFPAFPSGPVSLADLDPEAIERAKEVCRSQGITDPKNLEACIFDVAVTGLEEFAQDSFDSQEKPYLLVYENDFETDVGPEWSHGQRELTPIGGRAFLGRFQESTSVSLLLQDLPQHSEVTLTVDVFVIGRWLGNNVAQPDDSDHWSIVFVDDPVGTPEENFDTTFSNFEALPQSFPDRLAMRPDGSFEASWPAKTGAIEVDTLGFQDDAVYRITFTVPTASDTLHIVFAGPSREDPNRSWGIDNVAVHVTP